MNRSAKRQAMKKWAKSRSNKFQSHDHGRRERPKDGPRQKKWSTDDFDHSCGNNP